MNAINFQFIGEILWGRGGLWLSESFMCGSGLGKVKNEPWKLFFLRNFKKIVFTAELSRAVVPKLNQNHLGDYLAPLWGSGSVGLRCSPRTWISNKFSGIAAAVGLVITLWELLLSISASVSQFAPLMNNSVGENCYWVERVLSIKHFTGLLTPFHHHLPYSVAFKVKSMSTF